MKSNYANSYPTDEPALRHQYIAFLHSQDLSINDTIALDPKFKDHNLTRSSELIDISECLTDFKRTWKRYDEIDPMHRFYYTLPADESLASELNIWINKVTDVSKDLRKGLKEIIDEEKNRILDIKKQLTQHIVNFQHSHAQSELDLISHKIGFLMSDLPKNMKDVTQLVMFAVSNWENVTSHYLARHSRRFNNRNHQSILMHEAMQELRSVLRDIDENGLIKVDISINPLSYEKQILQVEGLISQLQYCKYWIADETKYIEWKRFYAKLSKNDEALLEILTSLEKSMLHQQLRNIDIHNWKEAVRVKGIPNDQCFQGFI